MKDDKILLAHGAGGKQTHRLISDRILRHFSNPMLDRLDDSALIPHDALTGDLVFTTDSYVVKPLFFPGADIGKLAVCGTVNDLSVMGARPLCISCGFIIEEGLELSVFERVLESMKSALDAAGISVVTGDTKVVEHGAADRLFINTAGIGVRIPGTNPAIEQIQPGDVLIVNGPMGDHGLAVMAEREAFPFRTAVKSDCAPLNGLVADLLAAVPQTRFMRDLTRGGLATTLNEITSSTNMGIELDEKSIPIGKSTATFCSMLGLDPHYLANEGKLVAIVPPEKAEAALAVVAAHEHGAGAAIIGTVTSEHPGKVAMRTTVGGSRIMDMLTGNPLPRIC